MHAVYRSVVRKTLFPLFAVTSFGTLPACSVETAQADPEEVTATVDDELLRKTASTSAWVYRGPVPPLEQPQVTVSLTGHTVHVQGLLPAVWTGTLPFYAVTEPDPILQDRTRLHLAYPIATVGSGSFTESGLPTRNPEPFTYQVCGGEMAHASNGVGSFGGFPFVEYVCGHRDRDGRVRSGIAFHGPITDRLVDGTPYWSLLRGPVSHACNRMLGEHVLELAHAVGFDRGVRGTPVQVISGFDRWHGRTLDVDYPATGWTRPPASSSFVFPIWQAIGEHPDGTTRIDFPRWACETSRCASMPPAGRDEVTGGLPMSEIACPDGYTPQALGTGGGKLCVSQAGGDAWGPFTARMTENCIAAGGGNVCRSDRWAADFARRIRGEGPCPVGAKFDVVTGYCQEGRNAFGPFPAALVSQCMEAGGGTRACRSSRWDRAFLARLQGRFD